MLMVLVILRTGW